MDRKKIQEEGLLEQYLLGELSAEENILIEKVLSADSELKKQFTLLETNFERMAFENAIEPSQTVKERLQDAVGLDDNTVIKLPKQAGSNSFEKMRLLVAASLAALFALSAFWFYSQWQTAEEMLQVVQKETIEIQNNLQKLEVNFITKDSLFATLNNKDVIPFVLQGNQLLPEARAVAFVNHQNKSVVINPQALPKLKENETYQMWADVDGEMINMGLVPTDQELVALAYIDKAESLNITIEPAGGNDHPTVSRLISNVYL
jgi:anti-sigma-K factor RskA